MPGVGVILRYLAVAAKEQAVVPENSATLRLTGEIRVSLDGDHLSVVKYASIKEDHNYKNGSKDLVDMIEKEKKARREAETQHI